MDTLDIDLLRTFSTIVSKGSFAAAAVQLGRTQAAITQQIQRLEDRAGHPLFEKQGRQKRLTDHGHRLLGYARHMLAIHDEALRSLQQQSMQGLIEYNDWNTQSGFLHEISLYTVHLLRQSIGIFPRLVIAKHLPGLSTTLGSSSNLQTKNTIFIQAFVYTI